MTTTTLTFDRWQTYITEIELATCLLAACYIKRLKRVRAKDGQGIRTRLVENSMKSFAFLTSNIMK